MEAWKPMQNVMNKVELFEIPVGGGRYRIDGGDTDSAHGDDAAKIADQAIMQMLCDND